DIPLSTIDGQYLKRITAQKINSENNCIIKFWFSTEKGFIGTTVNDFKNIYQHKTMAWIREYFDTSNQELLDYLNNNIYINKYFTQQSWTPERYYRFMDADFAFVIDVSKLDKSLSKKQKERKERKNNIQPN